MFQELKSYIDGRKIETGETRDYDLCVIGGGAAGITIAREFAGAKLNVCLVESGGFSFEEETDHFDIEVTMQVETLRRNPFDFILAPEAVVLPIDHEHDLDAHCNPQNTLR